MIEKNILEQLIQTPLTRCLDYYGVSYKREGTNYVCCCPKHEEKTPSFKIDPRKRGKNGGEIWRCFGSCQKGGSGAISFVAFMEDLQLRGEDFVTAARKTAEIARINIGDESYKYIKPGPIIEWVEPQNHYTFVKREKFTRYELEALGCRCEDILEDYTDDLGNRVKQYKKDADGDPVYKYSFATRDNEFDSSSIARDFNLFAVDYYIAPVNKNKGRTQSMKFTSTEEFPIFVYMYDNETWGRIYQPLGDYRFITWPSNNHPDLSKYLFGDTYLMRAFNGEKMHVLTMSVSEHIKNHIHPVNSYNENGKYESISKFDEVIMCSGGSDAINTFYHSNAHVCFMGSESFTLTKELYSKIDRAGRDIFIMFDLDNTGKRCALDIALKYLRFRILFLPEELKEIRLPGGKKAKDAKDFFTLFLPKDKEQSIRECFRLIMNSSRSLKFWERREKTDSDGNANITYDIDSGSVLLFLNAMGIWSYIDPDDINKNKSFVRLVDERIVEVISPKNIQAEVSNVMLQFLRGTFHYDTRLENKILDSPRIKMEAMLKLPSIELDLDSWGKDFDYIFCRNKAVRVTADEIKPVDYKNFPYHVYRNNVRPYNFTLQKPTFDIRVNPEYQRRKESLEKMKADPTASPLNIKKAENDLIEYGILNRFVLDWIKPFHEQPHYIQVIYNTGRMHWKKEERGTPLSEDEIKEQDAHFINKVAALGYLLFRYKDTSKPWAPWALEDCVETEGKASGGSFKSALFNLQQNVRGLFNVDGRSFEPGRGAINYYGVKKRETSIVHVEDINKGDIFYHFYNIITSGSSARNLNESENYISYHYWPKFCFSSNYSPNLSDPSTARRLWIIAMSDYYHTTSADGKLLERSPYTEFGYNLMQDNPSEREVNEFLNASVQFLQFYLKHKEKINPPMKNVSRRVLIDRLKEEVVYFFDDYFRNPVHLNRATSAEEILFQLKEFCDYSESAKEKLNKKVLRNKLAEYCTFEGLLFNPDEFLTTDSDRNRKEKRMSVWVTRKKTTVENGIVKVTKYREMSSSQEGCWYIGHPEVPVKIVPDNKEKDYDPLPNEEPRELKEDLPF